MNERVSRRAQLDALDRFCRSVLARTGCDELTVEAVTKALMHASRLGIDSHGVRLLPHYVAVFEGGRVNPRPNMTLDHSRPGSAVLDADDGHGALAGFRAMQEAVEMSRTSGVAAVAVTRSSHFGAAGAYALAAAEAGMLGLAVCNADKLVQLHDGKQRFHGTNPIAFAAPVAGQRPWLLDMATSTIPYNRVLLARSTGKPLPDDVAADSEGRPTTDPHQTDMLVPLGGADFGYKGAGLAGMVEILSAVLTGMGLSHQLAAMAGPDYATPRRLGQFFLAIDPDAFVGGAAFGTMMQTYLAALRGSARAGASPVMAPGDREWAEAERRATDGVQLDPETVRSFARLADRFGVEAPV